MAEANPLWGIRSELKLPCADTPGYDELEERRWRHIPRWGIETWFHYAPRRVEVRIMARWWSTCNASP